MKMKKQIVRTLLMVATLGLVTSFAVSGCAQSRQRGGGRIEGTWEVQVSIINCQTGGVIRSFPSLTMFMQGGTVIDSTSGMPQQLKTPGQGVWAHTTDNNYAFRFKNFNFDAANNYTGYTIIRHEANLDVSGDSYTSSGTAETYAANGNLIMNGCSSTVATRFGL
jgi:hypothetical protein